MGAPGQREVVDQHRPGAGRQRGEPGLGRGDPGVAPGGPVRPRVGVQQVLVAGDHAGPRTPPPAPPRHGRAGRPEAVVVEQQQRRDGHRAAGAVPGRVVVLRGEHAQPPAGGHQVLVAGLPAQLHRVLPRRPQLVVAGRPHHRGEPLGEQAQRPLQLARRSRRRHRPPAASPRPPAAPAARRRSAGSPRTPRAGRWSPTAWPRPPPDPTARPPDAGPGRVSRARSSRT